MNYPVFKLTAGAAALLLLGGCVTMPDGPSIAVLPGAGKNFEQFKVDDVECRKYALDQVGGHTANQAATDSVIRSAAVGTAVGIVAGTLFGGNRNAGGVGAGIGMLEGSAIGAGAAQRSANSAQRQYDNAYMQCMYAKGDQIPAAGGYVTNTPPVAPPPPNYPPPAPVNMPAATGSTTPPPGSAPAASAPH